MNVRRACCVLVCFFHFIVMHKTEAVSRAVVGQEISLQLRVPSNTYSPLQWASFFSNTAFFSMNGVAKLVEVSLDGSSQSVILRFIPRRAGEGMCIFPPFQYGQEPLFLEPFSYVFSLPPLPKFEQPLLDDKMQPIAIQERSELIQETQAFVQAQQRAFAIQEHSLTQFLIFLVFAGGVWIFCYMMKKPFQRVHHTWAIHKQEKALDGALQRALKKNEPAWHLLLARLLFFVRVQYGIQEVMTARELVVLLEQKKEFKLAQGALLIERYAYRQESCFEQFQESYDHTETELLKHVRKILFWRRCCGNTKINQVGRKP